MAAASREVQKLSQEETDWKTLELAGARFLPAGCGPCIGVFLASFVFFRLLMCNKKLPTANNTCNRPGNWTT